MYDTSNDLSLTTRKSIIELLNEHLADAIDLQLQAKQAHWHVQDAPADAKEAEARAASRGESR
jgi:DNA-binding ferritin-like protein